MTQLKLLVEDSSLDDAAAVAVSRGLMQSLKLFPGDLVLLRGKKRKTTIAAVVPDDNLELESQILMSKVVRSNLRYNTSFLISRMVVMTRH